MAKITTPLSLLIFFYILIVVFSLMVLGLAGVAAYDINHYLKNQQDVFAMKCCKKFLDQEKYGIYEECYKQSMEYFNEQKKNKTR